MNEATPSWGRYPKSSPARTIALRDRAFGLPTDGHPLLAYGNGRSYGDSCQNDGGTLLLTRGLDRFIAFDRETGVLRCEAGVLLGDILNLIVPHGWFLPVVPGTRFVTVGGAIANDVHGKNHHVAGSFGRHVRCFELVRSDGSRLACSPATHTDLFAATIGGLGLTGLITWVEIALTRIPGEWIAAETRRFRNLDDFFALSDASAQAFDHIVAWIDCLAPARQRGRGIFSRGNFIASPPGRTAPSARFQPRVPFTPPTSLIGGFGARGFNRWRYARARDRDTTSHYRPFFFPLDGIGDWNRLYGPRGFLQHQSVLPPDVARNALAKMLDMIGDDGHGSFLAVLKQFGTLSSPGLLSFPRPGTTLALDFPFRGEATLRLLERLDAVVAGAGGAVYPAKDARMSPEHFRTFFPNASRFAAFVDPAFSSGFWRRVAPAVS